MKIDAPVENYRSEFSSCVSGAKLTRCVCGQRPGARVEIEAVEAGIVIVIRRATKHVQGRGKGNHGVAVTSPRRQRGVVENVLGAYSRPRRILSRRHRENLLLRLGRF